MSKVAGLRKAVPFWLSLGLVPLAVLSVTQGGWVVLAMPLYAWMMVTVLDSFLGRNEETPDPQTDEADLWWYRLITLVWFPLQAGLIYGAIWWVTRSDLGWLEVIGLMFGIGVPSASSMRMNFCIRGTGQSGGWVICSWRRCFTAISAPNICWFTTPMSAPRVMR